MGHVDTGLRHFKGRGIQSYILRIRLNHHTRELVVTEYGIYKDDFLIKKIRIIISRLDMLLTSSG